MWFILSNTVVLACIYGTLAIGISVTWSSLGLLNLAYGLSSHSRGMPPGWSRSRYRHGDQWF